MSRCAGAAKTTSAAYTPSLTIASKNEPLLWPKQTVGSARPIVGLGEANSRLSDANIQLIEAQRLANLGSWSWDIKQNRIGWSDQLYDIYGLAPGEFKGTFAQFIDLVHPEDRMQVEASMTRALKSGRDFSHEDRSPRQTQRAPTAQRR